jgi:hypothetical protein
MTTLTITVNKNGFGRSVTVLASRVAVAEVLITVAILAVGFVLGRIF